MADGELTDIEKSLEWLWGNFRTEPKYIQMKLGNFRKVAAEREMAEHAIKFLKDTENVPDNAIVVMTPGHLTLLTDEDGNLLEFI